MTSAVVDLQRSGAGHSVRLRTGKSYKIRMPAGPSLTVPWHPDLDDPWIDEDRLELSSDTGYFKSLRLNEAVMTGYGTFEATFDGIKPAGLYTCRIHKAARPGVAEAYELLFEKLALQEAQA